MSSSFDTVQHALTIVRESLGLSEHHREIICDAQQLIDVWHEANHELRDAVNHNEKVGEATALLRITIRTPDPEERKRKQSEYYTGV